MKFRKLGLLICSVAIALTFVFPSMAMAKQPHWNRTQLKREIVIAGKDLHMSKVKIKRAEKYAVDIVFDGRHESGGGWYTGANHACKGIFQFNSGWHLPKSIKKIGKTKHWKYHKHNWRLNAHASTYRFMYTYKHGGYRSIHNAWVATLGK